MCNWQHKGLAMVKKSTSPSLKALPSCIRSFPYCKDCTSCREILFVNTLLPLLENLIYHFRIFFPWILARITDFPPGTSAMKHFTSSKAEVLLTTLHRESKTSHLLKTSLTAQNLGYTGAALPSQAHGRLRGKLQAPAAEDNRSCYIPNNSIISHT